MWHPRPFALVCQTQRMSSRTSYPRPLPDNHECLFVLMTHQLNPRPSQKRPLCKLHTNALQSWTETKPKNKKKCQYSPNAFQSSKAQTYAPPEGPSRFVLYQCTRIEFMSEGLFLAFLFCNIHIACSWRLLLLIHSAASQNRLLTRTCYAGRALS